MGVMRVLSGVAIVYILTAHCSGFILTDSSHLCVYIKRVNCTSFASGPICGTDNVTYRSQCEFSKAVCRTPSLTTANNGPCHSEAEKQEMVLSIVCADIMMMNCNAYAGTIQYCGSDRQTYKNVMFSISRTPKLT